MKLLHDSILYDPLKQRGHFGGLPGLPLTKVRVVFDVSGESSETNGTSEKPFGYFPCWKIPGGNSDFMSSNLFKYQFQAFAAVFP